MGRGGCPSTSVGCIHITEVTRYILVESVYGCSYMQIPGEQEPHLDRYMVLLSLF